MEERERGVDQPEETKSTPDVEVQRIVEAAGLLGVEIDETDVTQWLTALAAGAAPGQSWQVDARTGVFGHQLTLLDFDPSSLERYRAIADIVQLPDRPGVVETAIALSGSAAQGQIQPYPGDYDYFERVNIIADTREEAGRILADLIREKALNFMGSPEYELIEVKFGTWLTNVRKEGEILPAGHFVSWMPEEVEAGKMEVAQPDGQPLTIPWEYGAQEPGWCKLDWIITLPGEEGVANASNMLDVTWQTPEGELVPLDGFLDPYFQEVYLEASSIPLFAKLAGRLPPQVVGEYVRQLEGEVHRYVTYEPPNYGKVAKRLYNIFRLIGRYQEAAWIRELFDEPTSRLYQVWSLLDTLDDVRASAAQMDRERLVRQVDELVREVIETVEGPQEGELVMAMLQIRDDISGRRGLGEEWATVLEGTRNRLVGLVNEFFQSRLLAIPEVKAYIEELEQRHQNE